MTAPSGRRRLVLGSLAVVVTLVALTSACGKESGPQFDASVPADGSEAGPAAAPTAIPPVSEPEVGQRSAALDQLPATDPDSPVALRIEGSGIAAPVVAVSTDPDNGELAVPPTPDEIAWYEHGPVPGATGSAVLAADVDWNGRPGAFYALSSVAVGDTAVVTLHDGREIRFTVDSRQQLAKSDLPRDQIFAREGPAQLVLVTCGGDFDRATREYADNVVVFASLAAA